MRAMAQAALALVLLLLQVSLLPPVLGAAVPETGIALAVAYGLVDGPRGGAAVGLVAGMLADVLFNGRLLGVSAAGGLVAGLGAGWVRRRVHGEVWPLALVLSAAFAAVQGILASVLLHASGTRQADALSGGVPVLASTALLGALLAHILWRRRQVARWRRPW